jgi:LytS/YehU family sensor histidine kinase
MSERLGFYPWLQVPLWTAGNSVAGLVIGLAVGFFKQGGIEAPIVVISVLFGNVVGFTAMICAAVLYPRLRGLPPPLRLVLLGLALISGSAAGSIAVLTFYPLFVLREPRQAVAVVAINGILALIVGGVAYAYEGMRLRLQDSLREVEEVRLVEARLREEAARAELAALQARINPHFFFNTLNTITSLLDDDPRRAQEVVQTLADLFRYTFKVTDAAPVPLREELEFTRGYLEIEQARFGDRLRVSWDVEDEASRVSVPGLILQPLVENAVAHGIAPLARGGRLTISGRLGDGRLRLEVADDGAGLSNAAGDLVRDGHGLGNVRRRLETYYHGRASLELASNPAGRGTVARILIPRVAAGRKEAEA